MPCSWPGSNYQPTKISMIKAVFSVAGRFVLNPFCTQNVCQFLDFSYPKAWPFGTKWNALNCHYCMIVWVNVRITGQQNFMVTGFDYVCSQKGHLKSNNITICVLNSNAKCSNVTAPNQTWSLCIASARNFNPYLSGAPLRKPLCDLWDS